MKLLRPIFALLIAASLSGLAQKIDPMTQAVLNGYGEFLQENPKDYETLYERAAQYLKLGMLEEAKADLTNALQYTPQKDSDMRARELTLLSSVATALKDYETAFSAVDEALSIKPGDYYNLYKKGNLLLLMNRPEEAYRAFSNMQSLKSRSQEAYYGMARACIAQNNFSEAETLMKEVENADSNNPATFMRLGDLYREMNRPESAATNYIVALAMGAPAAGPMKALNEIAATNYKAVAAALDYAAENVDDKSVMLFLKGNIALDSDNFYDAEQAFSEVLKSPASATSGVYRSLAQARLGQNNPTGAMEAINQSINISPTCGNYLLKAQIEMASGNYYGAVTDANEAIKLDPNNVNSYIVSGEAYALTGQGDDAVKQFNKAIMLEPDNLTALIERAYAYQEVVKNSKAASADYNRIILEMPEDFPGIAIKGLALVKAGRKLEGDSLVESALAANPSYDDLYWGAVYYAQTGDLEKAKTLIDESMYRGMHNTSILKNDNTPWLNLAPIRHLLK